MTTTVSYILKSSTTQTLGALKGILAKGQAHAAAIKCEESALLSQRLFPDMFALPRQVQIACDTVVRGAARLAEIEIPSFPDTEQTFDELLARLRALIRRNYGKSSNKIELGEVIVDLAARTIAQSGEVVSLTPREYTLVEYLALHRGVVISRTELYEHLFDESDDTLSNLLDVHVSNVRRKLGASFITTRRGHGYCIE